MSNSSINNRIEREANISIVSSLLGLFLTGWALLYGSFYWIPTVAVVLNITAIVFGIRCLTMKRNDRNSFSRKTR